MFTIDAEFNELSSVIYRNEILHSELNILVNKLISKNQAPQILYLKHHVYLTLTTSCLNIGYLSYTN